MSALHEAARRVVAAWTSTRRTWVEDVNAAVLALDAALKAQPEPVQEPVAWMLTENEKYGSSVVVRKHKPKTYDGDWWNLTPLYTAPQPQPEPAQEPAGCETEADCDSQPWCRISGECHRRRKPAEPAQEQSESSCDECGKSKADGWALYCVECLEQFFHPTEPAQEAEPYAWHYTNNAGASVWHRGPSTRLDADMQAARDYPRVHKVTPLYTPPPQRKPLTEEEIDRLWHDNGAGIDAERFTRIARAIERKVSGE